MLSISHNKLISKTKNLKPNRPKGLSSALGGAHLGDQESKIKLTPRSWGGKLSREPRNSF